MVVRRRARALKSRWAAWLATAAVGLAGLAVVTLPAPPAAAAPCDAPILSPVACENTRTGNPQSEWGITGAGSSNIQGFATQISVDQGQTVGFKVDTTAASFRVDVYRMGYYAGLGARRVATFNASGNNNQPNCITDNPTGLVDCGNWSESASWAVPADAVSGIYFAKLTRTDATAGTSHVYFVVRDDDGASDMLFQTSDTTWQAYNAYGGNSLYVGSPAGRAYKVSYNRPFTTRNNAPEDFIFNAEYPTVRFLESNGYDVSYSTGVDTDRRGAELLEHRAFLSVGHDEYWSGQQRANVEAARAAGVHLAFLSGNEIFWKTRWENSIDGTGTPYRTLVTYKETLADAKIDPAGPGTWTGTWRDPRFSPPADGGRPENALTGTMFSINCCAINMVVGAADGDMRFWRNTRVANLTGNQTTTVGSNVIGYEWDEDFDNGSRPAGAFRVSQTTGTGEKLQDYGSSYAGGQSATHAMTMYRAPSGALVFSAGSIQWAWALDSNHDRGSAAADTAAQQAMINLFADMGVQPVTLVAGLTAATASSDTTAGTSAITSPAAGATLTPGDPVTITGTAADTGGGRVGGVEVSTDNGTTWRRATGRETWSYTFTPGATGSMTIRSRATDDSGNIQNPTTAVTVTVGSGSTACPCTIWPSTATPARTDPDADPVEVGVKFRTSTAGTVTGIRYYKPTQTSGTHVGSLWTSTGTRLGNVTFTNETASGWQQANFATPIPVQANTTYVASYFTPTRYAVTGSYFGSDTVRGPLTAPSSASSGGNGVYRYTSTAGAFPNQSFNAENYWVDVVFADVDTTKPTVSERAPTPGATDVSIGTTVSAVFDEPVQQSTISFELRTSGGTLVPSTTAYDAGTRTVTLTPNANLASSTGYTATLSGARDTAGNQMDQVSWSFTTATPDTTAPTVTARTPAPGATNVAVGANVTSTFSEPVVQSSVSLVLRNPAGTQVAGTTAYNATTRTVTLTPGAALAPGTQYTATLSGARDASGNVMTDVVWSFTTTTSTNNCPCTIFPGTATPAGTDPDTSPVELGVKFRANADGYVSGIRYYKTAQTSGTHVGSLWTSTGTRLGNVTFTGETASGWQEATFATPIPVTAGTTYVASYFTPSRYAVNGNYFTADVVRGPLTAPSTSSSGGNGVYRYTATAGVFPNQTFNGENYWVDVVYSDAPDTVKPGISSRTPAAGATGVPVGTTVSATFDEPVQQPTIVMELRNGAGTLVPSTTAYDAPTRTITLTPSNVLAGTTSFTATVSGARDTAGNQMDPVSWTFTTGAPDTTKPTVTSRSPAAGATGVAVGTPVSAVFSEDVGAGSVSLVLRNPAGTAVTGSTSYAAATRTVTFTPAAPLATNTVYTATLSGATDASGNVMDTVSWSFTTTSSSFNCPCTIWPSTATPATTDPDASSVELGVKFRASISGYVTGIRYYKPTQTSGTHVGSLWTSTGTRLGAVTFTGETASGWQEATFSSPIPVTGGQTYVASYFTPTRYAVTTNYFTADTVRGPLTAPSNASSGGNGLYRYTSTAGAFPNLSFGAENYWVDVVFAETANDTQPPTVLARTPVADATGVATSVRPSATLSEAVVPSSVSMVLRNEANQVVPSTTAYDAATTTVTLTPSAALATSARYTVDLSGAQDNNGNTMAPVTWSFETAAPPPPPPDQGPGGPIAVITSTANPSSSYLTEIVRAEGLNAFANLRNTDLSAATLAPYSVVVLGEVAITDAQVTALTDWVNAGGNLVAMRPDSRLLGLAGLTAATGTVSQGYLAVSQGVEPGAGITAETMQFHGTANRYTLNGATSVATLYTTATASTGQPAVTLRSVGANGGQVAVFAYDLARSVIQTRQGNPAWAGQERDGQAPIRSDDQYFGGTATDWVNLNKVQIPQADEQQRLLANLVTVMGRDRLPMPRFWYLPKTHKAVVVATGDDHGTGGTAGRFSTYASASPSGCSLAQWECARFSSYVYPGSPLSNSQATNFHGQGFEIGLHPQNGCANYSSLANLQSTYTNQLSSWAAQYSGIPVPSSNRFHCLVWSDWASQPKAELASGIRMDTNYYYWPGSWIANRPGFMTGGGFPMRFADTDGSMVDVYQSNTVMTDESGQSYPFTPNTLLDRALGAEGYYGAFTANLHTDLASTFEDTQALASAQSRNVPVITARQLLTWTDGRNGSSFSGLSWSGSALSFSIGVGSGATNLTAMLPTSGPGGRTLSTITRGGTPVSFTTMTVKGQQYAVFAAASGAHVASYTAGGGAAAATLGAAAAATEDSATLVWRSTEPGTATARIGTRPGALTRIVTVAERTEGHRLEVDGLRPGRRYYYRVVSREVGGQVRVWPAADRPPASFRTAAADRSAPAVRGVRAVALPDGTARVSWTTSEPATSRVAFGRSRDRLDQVRIDDRLARRHTVVLTDLSPQRTYWLRASSADGSGNRSRPATVLRVRTPRHGLAMQTLADFRTGTTTGLLRLDATGFGSLTLTGEGAGTYLSRVLDTGQQVRWLQSVVEANLPRGTALEVTIRTGDTARPDATWSSWSSSAEKGAALRRSGRYLQYRVELSATGSALPSVTAVGFSHNGRILAQDEAED